MAEKRTIELEIQDNSKSLKQQYREAVQELQAVSAQYGETSKEAAAAAQKAAELKDQIAFSKDLIEGFNPDAKFKSLEGAINGVLNGFQAFEGALGLVGVESEDVQKTLLRVQSAMALTQGINGILEAKDSFLQLGTVIKQTAIGQALLTAATVVYNTVVGTSTGLMKALRIALISTGIGALVVGVGLLVANFDKVVSVVKNVVSWFGGLSGTVKNIISVMFPIIGIIRLVVMALEELGIIDNEQDKINAQNAENQRKRTEAELKRIEAVRKAREKNFNNEQAAYDREIKLQQALGKSTLELQKAKINASIKYQEVKKKELQQDIEAFKIGQQFLGALGESLIGANIAEMEAKINELTNSIEDQKTDLQILDIESKKAATTTTTTTTSGGGGMTTTQKEKLNIERKLVDERLRIMEDGFDKEYALLQEKLKRDKEDAKKQLDDGVLVKKDYDKLLLQLDESFEADRKKLYDKSFNDRLQQRDFTINALIEEKKSEAEIEMAAWLEKREKQKEQDAEELARQKQLNQDKLKLAKDGLQLVSAVMDLFGKQDERRARLAFQVDKAAKISSATIAGYEAVLEAYKTGQKSPLTAVFPAYPYVQAGLAGAFAAVNIAKIGQSKFSASGGGGGSTTPAGGGATPMTANFSTIGSSGINQLAQLQQKPTQAYVVSGEVTSAQALDRNRVQNATL
jgi:uncharacterized membrane protein